MSRPRLKISTVPRIDAVALPGLMGSLFCGLLFGGPVAWAQTAPPPPPPPGTATNPRAALSCQLIANSSGNGTGAGGGGVMQLVGAPGLASGGAWAGVEQGGKTRQRTVNFNFAFSNFDQLMLTLTKPPPTVRFRVDKASTTVYTADGGFNGPHWAELNGVLNGSQRGWAWNDSVMQTRLPTGAPFANRWSIELRLSGQRVNTLLAAPPAAFEQFVRCELPLKR